MKILIITLMFLTSVLFATESKKLSDNLPATAEKVETPIIYSTSPDGLLQLSIDLNKTSVDKMTVKDLKELIDDYVEKVAKKQYPVKKPVILVYKNLVDVQALQQRVQELESNNKDAKDNIYVGHVKNCDNIRFGSGSIVQMKCAFQTLASTYGGDWLRVIAPNDEWDSWKLFRKIDMAKANGYWVDEDNKYIITDSRHTASLIGSYNNADQLTIFIKENNKIIMIEKRTQDAK